MRAILGSAIIIMTILFVSLLSISPARAADADGRYEFHWSIETEVEGLSIADVKGGYVIAGAAKDESDKCCRIGVVKIDRSGRRLWEKKFLLHRESLFARADSVDGKPVVSGSIHLSYREWGGGQFNAGMGWVVRFADDGTVEREEIVDSTEEDAFPSVLAQGVTTTREGDIILFGSLRTGIFDMPTLWVLDRKEGVKREIRPKIGRHRSVMVEAAYPFEDGAMAAMGMMYDMAKEKNTLGLWLTRIGKKGKVEWSKYLKDQDGYRYGYLSFALTGLADGGMIVGAGQEYYEDKEREDKELVGNSGSLRLVRVDKDGKPVWDRYIETADLCGIFALWSTANGELAAAGEACRGGDERIWLAIFSMTGELRSIRRFFRSADADLCGMRLTSDGRLIAVGVRPEKYTEGFITWVYGVELNEDEVPEKRR